MSRSAQTVVVKHWLSDWLTPEIQKSLDRLQQSEDVCRIALMPDAHVGNDVCVGTVLATRRLIYPAVVGSDIGCGMAALAMDCQADVIGEATPAAKLLDALYAAVPTNRHRSARAARPMLEGMTFSAAGLETIKRRDGAVQLGTLGRGNHFLEFQADAENRLWLMVHSGSRALGCAVRDWHMRNATRGAGGLGWLDEAADAGKAYLADAELARRYAAENRRAMAEAASELMRKLFGVRALFDTYFNCDHNHVKRETHFGEEYWVHRKGAAPARDGEGGIIPGSMGTHSYHVEGKGCPESLASSSHGAGRALSRHQSRRKVSIKNLHRQLSHIWFDHRFADRLRDEAPAAYKPIDDVMFAQRELVRVVRRLRPVMNYKGF